MQILDFRERLLVSRFQAADDLKCTDAEIESGNAIIIDLGDNLATTSWVDGFLVPVARRAAKLTIVTTSEITKKHVTRVFTSRGVRAGVAKTREEALKGQIGEIPAA